MNDAKSSEDLYLLNLIYNIYCRFSIRYEIFIKNVAEDSEYIKKITGLDLESLKKVLNVYKSYVPKNIPFGSFLSMVANDTKLLDDIKGKFSSFNPELSKKFKLYKSGRITDDKMRSEASGAVSVGARTEVPREYADIYANIIASDDSILESAWIFDTLNRKQRQELAKKIIDGINKHLGIVQKIKVRYTDNKKRYMTVQTLMQELLAEFFETVIFRTRKTHPTGLYNYQEQSIHIIKTENFPQFISTLSHEYGHFIDDKYPDLGMLGAQISKYARKVYNRMYGHHKKNATEQSSYIVQDAVKQRVSQLLNEYIEKNQNCMQRL